MRFSNLTFCSYFSKCRENFKQLLYQKYANLAKAKTLSIDEFIEKSDIDIHSMLNHVNQLIPQNDCGYSFEEVFNILNWGSNTMGNQVRILNQYSPAYVFSANRHFVKEVLKFNWKYRFEDTLTHQILKKSKLSNHPTSQIPYLKYKRPILLKYTTWAMRSFIDQKLMKMGSKFHWKRNRTIKTVNWQAIYNDSTNLKNYQSYFHQHPDLFSYPINYYENRARGESRPLSEIDLTAAIVPAMILDFMKHEISTS